MSGKVTLVTAAADPMAGVGARTSQEEVRAPVRVQPVDGTSRPDLRLIIEEAGEPGRYVYTLVDRRTGRIVSQLPREEVLKLKDQSDYAAGAVFDGKA